MSEILSKQIVPEKKEEEYKLSSLKPEDWVVLVLFWALAIVVFLQFFTRYALGAPIFWTEEMARYLLMAVGFLGSAIAARKGAHIFVEFGYRFFPKQVGFIMSTLADVSRVLFFGLCTYLSIRILPFMLRQQMVTLPISRGILYGIVLVGFALMTFRSIQQAWIHWKNKFIPVVNEKE